MIIPDDIYDIVLEMLQGSATPAQRQRLEEWMDTDQANRQWAATFARDWFATRWRSRAALVDTGQGWSELRHKMRPPGRVRLRRISTWAAACCLVAGVIVAVGRLADYGSDVGRQLNTNATLTISTGEQIELTESTRTMIEGQNLYLLSDSAQMVVETAEPGHTGPVMCVLSVPAGGQQRLVLPDGSSVVVNAGSRIEFPVQFDTTERRVKLDGQAHFDVVRDEGCPFIIRTGRVEVTVLGTRFDVSDYAGDARTVVTLVDGSVRVAGHGSQTVLEPSEQFMFEHATGEYSVRRVDTGIYTSWTEGLFRFDAMPLGELMNNLARQYGVRYRFTEDELQGVRFTGGFRRSDPLNKILSMISEANDVSFRIEGETVVVGRR